MFIATLIAAGALSRAHLQTAADALAGVGAVPQAPRWLDEGDAADLPFGRVDGEAGRAALEGLMPGVDVVVQPAATRSPKRLLVADMDSTIITVECIDELADYAGRKAEIAAITDRAMRGELDFGEALDARVALLKGLPADAIDRCRTERVRLTPGAATLVRTMAARGAETLLVSGGFTLFADPVGAAAGFGRVVANRLGIANGRLDGTVVRPIVDSATKQRLLEERRDALGLAPADTLAVGDGANDVPMIRAAGLGIAFHAKPLTAAAADARVVRGDLHALLWAQGIPRREWATPEP